jgi:hypothetical protein
MGKRKKMIANRVCVFMFALLFAPVLLAAQSTSAQPVALEVVDAYTKPVNGVSWVFAKLSETSTKEFAAFTTAQVGRRVEILTNGSMTIAPVVREAVQDGTVPVAIGLPPELGEDLVRRLKDGKVKLAVRAEPH